jgi:large subunit ribosomal protein L47
MAGHSVVRLSRSIYLDSRYLPPLFLAPALQSLRFPQSNCPSQTHNHPFSTTPNPQVRLRNREKNKFRGVSAIRRTGPRVPLSISKYPLPEPVLNPQARKEFKTREDHGLYGFFNEQRAAMTSPEDLTEHGRAWTVEELQKKTWFDLHDIWWSCVKERNWLATEANERQRTEAGYGDYEGQQRAKAVSTFSVLKRERGGGGSFCSIWIWEKLLCRANPAMMRYTFHSPI